MKPAEVAIKVKLRTKSESRVEAQAMRILKFSASSTTMRSSDRR